MGEIRVLLIDSNDARREARCRRLRAQGHIVEETSDAAAGADMALSSPPDVIVSELWMPSVSGVQLCRLMKSEAATCDVPVILCGGEDPKSRFWAERAGATAYVVNGRTSELMRALEKSVSKRPTGDLFFTHLAEGSLGIRDRIARQLDDALFEAVIAAEVRSLASVATIERLFDQLAQFMSQVTRYRYLALSVGDELHVHHHPSDVDAPKLAREALALGEDAPIQVLVDEDAVPGSGAAPMVVPVMFSGNEVAWLVLGPCEDASDTARIASIVARELGGAVKMGLLMREARRAATIDVLTGLPNRRAFTEWMTTEVARVDRYGVPLSLLILDVDHFKSINDSHGHAAGDHVLAELGAILRAHVRTSDIAARWGGEELVVAYTCTDASGAMIGAERLRAAIEDAVIIFGGERVRVTVSLGVAQIERGEAFDTLAARADEAMYAAKTGGRNRAIAAAKPQAA